MVALVKQKNPGELLLDCIAILDDQPVIHKLRLKKYLMWFCSNGEWKIIFLCALINFSQNAGSCKHRKGIR